MTKESKALAIITPEEQAYLDSLGSEKSNSTSGPTQLVINTKSKDADGVKRTIGAWHLEGTDKYFDGIVTFRPIRHAYKLIRYTQEDNNNWSWTGESVYFNDFRDEIIDSLGGLALGRIFGRELKTLPKDKQDENKKLAGTYFDIFGLVTLGDDAELVPCTLRVRGGKLKAMLDAFASIPKDKRFSQYNYKLEACQETDEKTKEVNDYWSIKVEPDMSQVLPISPILNFDKEILEYIRDNNHKVLESHKKNRAKLQETPKSFDGSTARVINAEPVKSIILDDELPF